MDYKDLILLIDHLDQSSLSYLDYQVDAHHVVLSKKMPQIESSSDTSSSLSKPEEMSSAEEKPKTESEKSGPAEAAEIVEEVGETVKSPMIGVAYLQANPDEDVYVNVGDQVKQGDTICIIEAMKLMNEIQATQSGIVTEILIENEEVVEFNQPLIRIK